MKVAGLVVLSLALMVAGVSSSAIVPMPLPYVEPGPTPRGYGPYIPEPINATVSAHNDMFPHATEFDGRLHVVWQRADPEPCVLSRNYRGSEWSDIVVLSPKAGSCDDPAWPHLGPMLVATEETLVCVWTTNSPLQTEGSDDDVVFRFT